MELMSSILLCTLVALLPQTLGKSEFTSNVEIKRAHRAYKNSPRAMILNMKGAYANDNIDQHAVFEDKECQKCHSCMEQAIKAQGGYVHSTKYRPSPQELHDDLLRNQIIDNRFKRDVQKMDPMKDTGNGKISKPRKLKPSKTASVTKYDFNGDIYALKVIEINESDFTAIAGTCQIYSVRKSTSCESPERGEILIQKRKNPKKMRKMNKTAHVTRSAAKLLTTKLPTTLPTTKIPVPEETTPKVKVAIFKKRETDSDTPDFMPSIEELVY